MKLILKNSNLVFAQGIQDLTIPIQPTSGEMYYVANARSTIAWDNSDSSNKAITSGSKYQRSQVINVDRTKYNAFKIVTSNPNDVTTYAWITFAGSQKGQRTYQSSPLTVNTKHDFRDSDKFIIDSKRQSLDSAISSIDGCAGEIVHQFAISLKNDGTAPSMTAEEFAAITIVLMAE